MVARYGSRRWRAKTRIGALGTLVLAAALAIHPPEGRAARGQLRVFQDDRLLLQDGPRTRDATLDRLAWLGVDVVRVQVTWAALAPRSPRIVPRRLASARRRGMRPLLTLSSPAPAWAAGRLGPFRSRRPSSRAYRAFVTQLGRHFDGRAAPRVDLWALWNEPNHPEFLSPQRSRRGGLLAPAMLRALLRAGGAGLRATGHGGDTILIGEWLPVGSGQPCGLCTQPPLAFARELLCLDARDRPLRRRAARRHPGCGGHFRRLPGTAWSVHPYAHDGDPLRPPPGRDDLGPTTLGRLHALLVRAARAGRVRRHMPLWETEFGVQTNPPDRRVGVPLVAQARYLNQAEWVAWRLGFVRAVAQYALRDDLPLSGFQSGLLFANGTPKPALAAYRLALIVTRGRARAAAVRVWMRLPPHARAVTILPPAGRAVRVRAPRKGHYLTLRLRRRFRPRGLWRAHLDDGSASRPASELLGG